MKTAIKLAIIYMGMQILGVLVITPFAMAYTFIKQGSVETATSATLAPAMLMGFLFMGIYLWKKGYLSGDKRMFSLVSASFLAWTVLLGGSSIFLIDFLMSNLSFLPDWMGDAFNVLQSGWLGILCVSVLGPILEELLFRGAITKILLEKYSPVKAILISGLIFGIFHINPVQVVGAIIMGVVFAWIYYKTKSLVPCILIHILNNSLSVYSSIQYPDVDCSNLLGEPIYSICLLLSAILFLVSWRMMSTYRLPDISIQK